MSVRDHLRGLRSSSTLPTSNPVRYAYRRMLGEIENVRAAQQLAPLVSHYLPASEWTLNAFHLQYICHEVRVHGRPGTALVELGSGSSTPLLSKVARMSGLDFVSVEHDDHWVGKVREWMGECGEDPDQVAHAPVDRAARWYRRDAMDAAVADLDVAMVLVDGPHGQGATHRPPAAPWIGDAGLTVTDVFVDDCHREAERQLAAALADGHDVDFVGARRELAHVRLGARRPG